MTTRYSASLPAQSLCPICQLLPAQSNDVFCQTCRTRANAHINRQMLASLVFRFFITVLIEGLLGIFTGFLLFIPIGAASSGHVSLADVAMLFGMNLLLIAPIIASLYTWTLRSWIARPQAWATANTIGAVSLGVLMCVAVFLGGLRLTTLSDLLLSVLVIIFEWLIGVAVAWWQRRLLTPPFQQVASWQRWSMIGWTIASIVHLGISVAPPLGGMRLWLGTAAAFFIYGIITHGVLAWTGLQAMLAAQLHSQ